MIPPAVQQAPYGAWESPITSKAITAGTVRLAELKTCGSDLYWLEGRPQEGGRNVLCRLDSEKVDVTASPDFNVRSRVHEYGGAAVALGTNRNELFAVEFSSQQWHRLLEDGTTQRITGKEDTGRYRFADGVYNADKEMIYCVREDHGPDHKAAPSEVVNEIVSVHVPTGETTTLATGNDFYAAPRLSPNGTQLAYVTWNHPNMPWDASELCVLYLKSGGQQHQRVAGYANGDVSVIQPQWHPQTGDLFYLSDQSGFYNLYKLGMEESLFPMDSDWGGDAPGWTLGQEGYTFLPHDGRLVATYQSNGESVLLVAQVAQAKRGAPIEAEEYGPANGLPAMFGHVVGGKEGDLYFLGGSPSTATSVYHWNLEEQGPAKILARSATESFPDEYISIPRHVEFPTTGDRTAYGYYYAPKNDHWTSNDKAPPLLVKAHGGPTACTRTSFSAPIQFWTSRGFAVLDVDYGGSTGYGREYRRRLHKSWGIVDMDDVCAGAQYLVEEGLADGKRLCIDGGSAGGYTTLAALAFRDVFQAGCSLYGIGDLTALAGDTHKFESRYLDGLVGKYPEEESIYKERSPIESVDTLSCPILLLQGAEDKVVPPNQARMMHEALRKKGIPTCLKIYEGEQHGFRKAENIEDALESELAFYGKVFGIPIPGAVDLEIDNL